jgi:hypothetical protein
MKMSPPGPTAISFPLERGIKLENVITAAAATVGRNSAAVQNTRRRNIMDEHLTRTSSAVPIQQIC